MFPTFDEFLKNKQEYTLSGGNVFIKTHCAAITNVKNENDVLKWNQCKHLKLQGNHEYFCEQHKTLICQDPQKVHVIPNLLKDIKHFVYFPPFPPVNKSEESYEEFNNDEEEEEVIETTLTTSTTNSKFPLLSTFYEYTFNLVQTYDKYKSTHELHEESESSSEEEEETFGSRNIFRSSNKSQKETDREFVESVKESLGESLGTSLPGVQSEPSFHTVESVREEQEEEEEEEEHLEEEEKEYQEQEEREEERRERPMRNRKRKQDKFEFIQENLGMNYEEVVELAEQYDIQIPKGRKSNAKKEAILQLIANAKYWKGELKAGKSPEFNGKNFKDSFFTAFE